MLFADADGATKFSDVTKLEAEIKKINANEVNCANAAIGLWC